MTACDHPEVEAATDVVTGVYPERAEPTPPTFDSRDAALRVLRLFLSTLRFMRAGNKGGEPIPFRIPIENILTEWPDNVKDLKLPSLVFLPSAGSYDQIGLGPAALQEETIDVYGPGTGVLHTADWIETFTIEAWASKVPERRAIALAVESALLSAADGRRIRFRLPDHYGIVAAFSLEGRTNIDDADAVRNRRRAHVTVQLEVPVVKLVNLNDLKPQVRLEVCEQSEVAVDVD